MKSAGLSQSEQTIYAHIDELKSEVDPDCDRYWRGSVDWRPSKPVAPPPVEALLRSND